MNVNCLSVFNKQLFQRREQKVIQCFSYQFYIWQNSTMIHDKYLNGGILNLKVRLNNIKLKAKYKQLHKRTITDIEVLSNYHYFSNNYITLECLNNISKKLFKTFKVQAYRQIIVW